MSPSCYKATLATFVIPKSLEPKSYPSPLPPLKIESINEWELSAKYALFMCYKTNFCAPTVSKENRFPREGAALAREARRGRGI